MNPKDGISSGKDRYLSISSLKNNIFIEIRQYLTKKYFNFMSFLRIDLPDNVKMSAYALLAYPLLINDLDKKP